LLKTFQIRFKWKFSVALRFVSRIHKLTHPPPPYRPVP
jgi:hypothetical protein